MSYKRNLLPKMAVERLQDNPQALFVDVRSKAEYKYVGFPENSILIPWIDEPDWEPNPEVFSNHWLSCIVIDEQEAGFSREDVRLSLEKENIESRPLWNPLHLQPIFKDCKSYTNGVSEDLFNRGLCLPSGTSMKNKDLERVVSKIKELYEV